MVSHICDYIENHSFLMDFKNADSWALPCDSGSVGLGEGLGIARDSAVRPGLGPIVSKGNPLPSEVQRSW